ncbi:MAG: enoyl-CoA hydratase/isomerase family protein [Leptospirales bacterium]|nr:enoyl-CoA hydratase/isomerase family protein [Leptospirales bacterium]
MAGSAHFPFEIEERKRGKVAILTIHAIDPNNTLSGAMLPEMLQSMKEACAVADGILVRSAHPKFFSNGLDGKLLLDSSPAERLKTIQGMTRFLGELLRIEKPWIAEIAGHAMAGGAVISVCADYRYMLKDSGRIGFSEMAVGLPLPRVYTHFMHRLVHPRNVREMVEGMAYKPEEALAAGLIDGVEPNLEALRAACMKRMDAILRLDQEAWILTRKSYRSAILHDIERDEPDDLKYIEWLIQQPVFERALNNIAGRNR